MPHLESARRSDLFPGQGPAFTEATLYEVRAAARNAANDSNFLMTHGGLADSDAGIMAAIFKSVKEGIAFRPDPDNTEAVREPLQTLALRYGDCDDTTALVAASLLANGIPVRIRGIKKNPASHHFDHVYALGYNRDTGAWIPLDTQLDFREAANHVSLMEISA